MTKVRSGLIVDFGGVIGPSPGVVVATVAEQLAVSAEVVSGLMMKPFGRFPGALKSWDLLETGCLSTKGFLSHTLSTSPGSEFLSEWSEAEILEVLREVEFESDRTVVHSLRAAAEHHPVQIFTNSVAIFAPAIDESLRTAGLPPAMHSCRVGARKPSPFAFELASRLLGARHSVLLDDELRNCQAAQKCGFDAWQFAGTDTLNLALDSLT